MRKIMLGVAALCCMSLMAMAQTDDKYSWMELTQTDPYTSYVLDKNGQILSYNGTALHAGIIVSSIGINCPDIPETAEKMTDVSERISYTNMYGGVELDTTVVDALDNFNKLFRFSDSSKTVLVKTYSIYRGGQYTFRNTLPGIGYDYSKVVDILDEPSVRFKCSSIKLGEDINVEVFLNTGYPYETSQFTGNEKAKLTLYYSPVDTDELTEVASTEKQLSLYHPDQPLVAAVDTIRMKFEKPAVGKYMVRISSDWNYEDANTQVFISVKDTVVTCTNGNTEYARIQDAVVDVNEKDTIKLVKDVALKSTIQIPADVPAFTLDLNGHVISGDSIPTPTDAGQIGNIIQNFGKLTIIDSDSLAVHTDSLSTMTGGILTGGKGGYNFNGYDESGTPQYTTKLVGGAIYNSGHLTMNGGTVYKNTAQSGGGIYLSPTDSTSMVLKGKVIIKDNTTNGKASNLCCCANDTCRVQITLDSLTEGSAIGISAETGDAIGSTYQFSTNGTADDVKYFSADEEGSHVQYNAAGYLELLTPGTGVNAVNTTVSDDGPVYDLQGRRMSKDSIAKGVYIKNNRKIFTK